MAAIRDSLDTCAACTLPAVPLHWQRSWGLDLSGLAGQEAAGAQRAAGTQGAAGTQRAAGFSPRGPSAGATAGIHDTGGIPTSPERERAGPIPTSPERERAGSGMGVAPGVSPVSGIHNAGGIGGLLAVEAPQAVGDPLRHWYFYDGNGNVGQLLAYDATGPTVNTTPAAKYEYDPYGQLINWTETIGNPFRFSTKWHDAEASLVYYGRRFYHPTLGRWLNRDPLEEQGGLNLYLYVDNSPITIVDPAGLASCDPAGTAPPSTGGGGGTPPTPSPGMKRCCCATGLSLSANFGAFNSGKSAGHTENWTLGVRYVDGPESDCTLNYWEWTDKTVDGTGQAGGTCRDNFGGSSVFANWKRHVKTSFATRDGRSYSVTMKDTPYIRVPAEPFSSANRRDLYQIVRLSSGKGCKCDKAYQQVITHQSLAVTYFPNASQAILKQNVSLPATVKTSCRAAGYDGK